MKLPATCTFDEWPELRERLGLRFVEWQGSLGGELIMVVEPKDPQSIQSEGGAPAPLKKPEPSKLTKLIRELLKRAATQPCVPCRAELAHGLRVEIKIIGDKTHLLLARQGASYPSNQEWKTVMAHWPYDPSMDISPEFFDHKGWRCMRAAWPTPGGNDGQV